MEDWISLSIYNVLIDNNVLLFLTVCVIWNWLYWFIRDVELRYKTRRSCILHNTLEITCIWNHRQWKPFALHCFFFLRKYQNSTFNCQVRRALSSPIDIVHFFFNSRLLDTKYMYFQLTCVHLIPSNNNTITWRISQRKWKKVRKGLTFA